jgi:hypothetical protein
MTDIFKNRTAVLATMHAKEKVIAPLFKTELGIEVFVPPFFDTDQFGTFTRDIKRKGDQLDAARRKAYAAMAATGSLLGVSSEGSFGSHPASSLIPYNVEIVLLVDKENDLEVAGYYASTTTNLSQRTVRTVAEAVEFARAVSFPEHGLVVRKNEKDTRYMVKGVATYEELEKIVAKLLARPFTRSVFLETDMRAHYNPTRMEHIRLATLDLIERLKTPCPECGKPGYGKSGTKGGLPCGGCGFPTDVLLAEVRSCPSCMYREEIRSAERYASPLECSRCNP